MDSKSTRDWLRSGAPEKAQGEQRLNPHGASQKVTIKCFPYGLAEDIEYDGALDLFVSASMGIHVPLFIALPAVLTVFFLLGLLFYPLWKLQITALYLLLAIPGFFVPLRRAGRKPKRAEVTGYVQDAKIERIIASSDGLKFVYKRENPTTGVNRLDVSDHAYTSMLWKNLKSISLVGDPDDYDSLKVQFKGPYGSFAAGLVAIHTKENWSGLARAIKHFAPAVVIDDSILSALSISSTNNSFTELWLECLTRPPDENYLVPIASGDQLQDGRFCIQGVLGVGGQGHAYLAGDASSGQTVVLKEYLMPGHASPVVRERALKAVADEIALLGRLSHPQIVRLLDSFVERNRAFLVFNRIVGVNLRQHIEQHGRLPADAVLELAHQMVEILGYLHSSSPPIIHRDFTPDNLIIDNTGRLTLVDFTIAEPTGISDGRPPAGKPAYMPPEQYGGDTIAQSDIYAMGATLFFVLTGDDPEPLMQLSVPAKSGETRAEQALAQVIQRCTAQNFRERFSTCQEMKLAL